jgi:hypothetical protein
MQYGLKFITEVGISFRSGEYLLWYLFAPSNQFIYIYIYIPQVEEEYYYQCTFQSAQTNSETVA